MRLDTLPQQPFADAAAHVEAECRCLDERLADHVRRMRAEGRFNDDPMRGLYLREAEVLAELSHHTAHDAPPPDRLRSIIDTRAAQAPAPPLYAIADAFGLDAFERQALFAVVAPSLDRRYQIGFAHAHNDATRRAPTPGLLVELFGPHQRLSRLACFSLDAPLLDSHLLRFAAGEEGKPLADRALAVDDRVVLAVLGRQAGADPRLAAALARLDPVREDWAPHLLDGDLPDAQVLVFDTHRDIGQRALAARQAARHGLGLLQLDFAMIGEERNDLRELATLLVREAKLAASAVLIEARDALPAGRLEGFIERAAELGARLFVSTPPQALDHGRFRHPERLARISTAELDAPRRLRWWQHMLESQPPALAQRLAWTTRLGPAAIGRLRGFDAEGVADAARALAVRRLPPVLQAVPRRWRREDLQLPDATVRQLDELTAFVAHWPKVVAEWGFGASNPQARHCLALFAGPSGTGKTMAAGIVAAAAGLDLYRANLAAVFDKYIGETEKQLDRLFDAAADAGVALLFDEADVLFGTRTEMRDSHDRYANLSVAYLLQRIEGHEGLVILCSNLPRNMDEAFARRLTHAIAFPLPDATMREALWRKALPRPAQVAAGIDFAELAATFEISGGAIRNAALAAAYLAAAEGMAIDVPHLLRAIEREMEKTGRAPIAADFGRLADRR